MRVTQHTNTARRPFDKSLFSFSARSEKKLWKADAPQSQWERRRGRKDRIASGTDHVTCIVELINDQDSRYARCKSKRT